MMDRLPFGWKNKMKNYFQRNLVVIQLVILFFYIFARVSTTLPALHAPRELADTKVYVNVSNRQILGENFLYVDRPFAFPLLLQIVDRDFQICRDDPVGTHARCLEFAGLHDLRLFSTDRPASFFICHNPCLQEVLSAISPAGIL